MKQQVIKKEIIPAILATAICLTIYKVMGRFIEAHITNSFYTGFLNQLVFAFCTIVAVIVLRKSKIFRTNKKAFRQGWFSASLLLAYIALIAFIDIDALKNVSVSGVEVCLFLVQMFLVGVCEEVLFRGLIQNAFHAYFKEDTRLHVFYAIFCTGIMFGLTHLLNGLDPTVGFAAATNQAIGTIPMGMYFGTIYYRTGKNIWYVIILHGLYDLVISIMSGRLSGVTMESLLSEAQTIDYRVLIGQGVVILLFVFLGLRSKRMNSLLVKEEVTSIS